MCVPPFTLLDGFFCVSPSFKLLKRNMCVLPRLSLFSHVSLMDLCMCPCTSYYWRDIVCVPALQYAGGSFAYHVLHTARWTLCISNPHTAGVGLMYSSQFHTAGGAW